MRICLTRRAWRPCFPQHPRRRSRKQTNENCPQMCGKKLSTCTRSIHRCVLMRLRPSVLSNSIIVLPPGRLSWFWQAAPLPLRLIAEIEEPQARRRLIIDLHTQGWNAKSIAGYLQVSRNTVHKVPRRFAEEQFAGLDDKSHARERLRKVDISTIQEIKKLSENPELGAYRVSAALEQMGIKLSPSTCGRYLGINRRLYHLQMPRNKGGRPKKVMPYAAQARHRFWRTFPERSWPRPSRAARIPKPTSRCFTAPSVALGCQRCSSRTPGASTARTT
jgi:transposase